MIVMKFGGTSTQDASAMMNVAQIVKSRSAQRPVIVISAIAQATNNLEGAGKLAAAGKPGEARDTLLKLFDRHFAIVDELIKDKVRHAELRKTIAKSLAELEEMVKGVSILRELTPRTMDTFYCYGELLSSRLVSAVLQEQGIRSEWVDTKEFMVTDEHYNSARPIMELVVKQLNAVVVPLVKEGKIPVTQGFIGVTQSGCRTTMGRESSDYSASVIGSALNVEDVQIWTDVDGVLTADPRIVTTPKKVKVLSFQEAFELSFFGAKVLHPNTMLPAIEKNIPIHIFNSKRSHLSGTLVTANAVSTAHTVKSIAFKRGVVILNAAPQKRFSQYSFWEHIFGILTKYGVASPLTVTSDYNVSMVLEQSENIPSIKRELEEICVVEIIEGKGIISIVGTNLRNSAGISQKVFESIAGIGVSMISFGATTSNLSFLVDDAAVPDAVRRMHTTFFESTGDADTFEQLEPFTAEA
jgi:aspartate kinase